LTGKRADFDGFHSTLSFAKVGAPSPTSGVIMGVSPAGQASDAKAIRASAAVRINGAEVEQLDWGWREELKTYRGIKVSWPNEI
jgi:hypothetical protein